MQHASGPLFFSFVTLVIWGKRVLPPSAYNSFNAKSQL
jgi:hypothetical protein